MSAICYIDVISIFDDPDRIEFENIRKGETRVQTIGMVHDTVLFLVYTSRGRKKRIISKKLHVSQKEFASYFGVSVRTIQEWEQHRRTPTTVARNFLKVIDRAPKAVLKALAA